MQKFELHRPIALLIVRYILYDVFDITLEGLAYLFKRVHCDRKVFAHLSQAGGIDTGYFQ